MGKFIYNFTQHQTTPEQVVKLLNRTCDLDTSIENCPIINPQTTHNTMNKTILFCSAAIAATTIASIAAMCGDTTTEEVTAIQQVQTPVIEQVQTSLLKQTPADKPHAWLVKDNDALIEVADQKIKAYDEMYTTHTGNIIIWKSAYLKALAAGDEEYAAAAYDALSAAEGIATECVNAHSHIIKLVSAFSEYESRKRINYQKDTVAPVLDEINELKMKLVLLDEQIVTYQDILKKSMSKDVLKKYVFN